ncbi:phosphotransferase [Fictibacillus nanhaiensis]|uniref:phosphotransferase n=1 Tax=Fictibacillus nanhaiensis TaxID=742169 RepID=UPI001C93BA9E|nr:phosphotransferase [Fictibacillus nanhaiensis]MBY6037749.1 phosphotransferase [Fictibacillus nanhaiensis]
MVKMAGAEVNHKKVVSILKTELIEQSLWEHLKSEAEGLFGFTISKVTPIKRGWLNEKWKIETDEGTFLLKQYNRERLKKYDLNTIRKALHTQNRAFSHGIPCPELLQHNGNLLHESSLGEYFTVMRFMKGSLITAGSAHSNQMESLGQSVGKLHKLLNDGNLPPKSETMFKIPPIEERLDYWDSVLLESEEKGLYHLQPFMKLQKEATLKLNLSEIINFPSGWSHRDLWVDNLLFFECELAAILDFDRMNYDFPAIDVARVVISTCLQEESLNLEAVQAFVKGYSNTNELSLKILCSSMKLLWYLESTWWISVTMEHQGDPPKRFAKEMIWLAENLEELELILFGNKEQQENLRFTETS